MGALISRPAQPQITETNVGDHTGKTYMITGATSGIGKELAQILYSANANIWMTARSKTKAEETISAIRSAHPEAKGRLEFILLDFSDLKTIKPAVEDFLQRETKLDILWNNAGLMIPPKGTVTAQNHEAQLGTNCLGPLLFTKLLTDLLVNTAKTAPQGQSRVVWVASSAAAVFSPSGGGVPINKLGDPKAGFSQWQLYGISKAGNILQSAAFSQKYGGQNITSVAMDPGNLATPLYKDMPRWQHAVSKIVALQPPVFGAYTMLFSGLSKEVSNGDWVIPWGKVASPRADIANGAKAKDQGGSGLADEFWAWCEKEVAAYV